MNDNAWKPDPELLAAFFDGELEGRDEVADLCARVETWLEANPEAAEAWGAHQELKKLWANTTPAEPSALAWAQTLDRIIAARQRPAARPPRGAWLTAAVIAASILLFVGIIAGGMRYFGNSKGTDAPMVENTPLEEMLTEMMVVAQTDEITILRIDTDDIDAVIVGIMPVTEPLEMVSTGEADIRCKCPRVVVQNNPPMIWGVSSSD